MKNFSFYKTCDYVLSKQGASIMGGNMAGRNLEELVQEFSISGNLNRKVKRPVYHFALALSPDEPLDDEEFMDLGDRYVHRMGLDPFENQYIMVRHTDQEHHHIHIIASRINTRSGKAVAIWNDHYRNQIICRQIEREYGLRQIESTPMTAGIKRKIERDWNLTMPPGQVQGRKAMRSKQRQKLDSTGIGPVQTQLQDAIALAAGENNATGLTMPEFVQRLQARGIKVQIRWVTDRQQTKATGSLHEKIQGISYQLNGVAMAGNDLGAWYTFPGLQKHWGVNYQSDRDDAALKTIVQAGISELPVGDEPVTQAEISRSRTWDSNGIYLDEFYATAQDLLDDPDAETNATGEEGTEDTDETDDIEWVEDEPGWETPSEFTHLHQADEAVMAQSNHLPEDGDGVTSRGLGVDQEPDREGDGAQGLLDAVAVERLLEQQSLITVEPVVEQAPEELAVTDQAVAANALEGEQDAIVDRQSDTQAERKQSKPEKRKPRRDRDEEER
ncbi:hypothetical protein BST81_16790 [Leptolyngbya sp. 'hensonii']|uniref:relaxase/mobilization nuclease domain-containing protein n=1 Tax=Leptolyngbya sp. 'hensonii' TaxID=1922337 RepID=UPI00096531C1|nr:relaxase/mobilization nuclease domain-containing protein [Leptolyngbya sp. 'hensonii']OLP17446.1 hypothetical protein BST81_16790 [Leptolyngbya sp. 'hensonii']